MAIISRVTTWSDGQTLTASALNGEINNILADYNGNITDANIASGAAISPSKINKTFPSGAIVGDTDSQTLTNKTLTSPTINTPTFADAAIPAKKIATGAVLQVVQATYSTSTVVSNATPIDTGLTASITPQFTTSKILVLVSMGGMNANNAGGGSQITLLRGGSVIMTPQLFFLVYGGTDERASLSFNYFDSPASTSAQTYKVQFNLSIGSGGITAQRDSATSSMILMEVAG